MARTPEQLRKAIRERQKGAVDEWEKRIDKNMEAHWDGESPFVFHAGQVIGKLIFEEVRNRFKGWAVTKEERDCGRNENEDVLTFKVYEQTFHDPRD